MVQASHLGFATYTQPSLRWLTYSLWGSPDAFNDAITGAYCEGTNIKYKVKTIIQDNGCLLFYNALARSGSKQESEWPSEYWAIIL